MQTPTNNNIESLVSDSRLAFIQGRYDESLKLAKQALEMDADNADAHQCAGNAYMSKRDLKSAISHYRKAVEAEPENGDRYFNLAYAYASDEQQIPALEAFAKADEVGCSPNVVGQLYKIMAMVCFDMNRYQDAVINFLKAEQIIGIDMDILQRKALSYSMMGEIPTAIEVANQMKLVAPSQYIGYRIAFNLLLDNDRHDECEEELARAERFATLTPEYYFDWLTYLTTCYQMDGDKSHLEKAIAKIDEELHRLKPDVEEVIDCYINAAEVYVQMENADMALKCLNAAENPIRSFNNGFTVLDVPDLEKKPIVPPKPNEISRMVDDLRRREGERKIAMIGRDLQRNPNLNLSERMTPAGGKPETAKPAYTLDSSVKASYTAEKLDQIHHLYVMAYTQKKDHERIRLYASKLANSADAQKKCIGKYALVKAMRDSGMAGAEEEYRSYLKYLRNAMIKDPSDMLALNFRVQCHIDLEEYEEAERLCTLLSDALKKPLMEQINAAKSGGEA